ncbi:TPA: VWA domain-containing protein, partial [bacterium]|nr:VWA domain-containing protein [bacterium]
MGFSSQNFLYLLFLIPLLILLYILRLRRRNYIISSVILWEQDIEDIKANTLFQRLRKNILLPLQLIILVLLIFALSRPFLQNPKISIDEDVILILDTSASMKSTDSNGSRFEMMKSSAIKIIEELNNRASITLIQADISPKIILGTTSDKSKALKTINQLQPSDTSNNLPQAIKLASSILNEVDQAKVILMSDGADGANNFDIDLPIEFMSFGKKDVNNIGIVSFDVIRDESSNSSIQVFVSIMNFGNEKQPCRIILYHNNIPIDAQNIVIIPKEQRSVIFENINYQDGIIMVSIEPKDDFIVDNNVYYVINKLNTLKVMLVGKDNFFIESAIKISSVDMELTKKKSADYRSDECYDLIIFNGFMPDNMPDCNAMFIDIEGDLPFAKLLSRKNNPIIIDWDKANPLMRFVDLSGIKISNIGVYDMPAWAKPLIDADVSSILFYGEFNRHRIITIPFSLDTDTGSNFVMLPAFPIFMSNVLSWISDVDDLQQVKTGDIVNISVSKIDDNQDVTVKKPDGITIKANLQNGRLIFTDTNLVGIYQISGTNIQRWFAVNLLNKSESNISSHENLIIYGHEAKKINP